MGKGKMNLLDVRAMVKELKAKLLGLRIGNIYNLSAKTFVLKLSGQDAKHMLLIESGVRLHTTRYAREHDKLPSNFCAKLRKHLRLKRLEAIEQIGLDRIVDMQFGHGEQSYHLILEFYAQGNIILTDSNYRIIMLLRVHTYTSSGPSGGLTSIGAGAVMADGDAPAPPTLSKLDSKDVTSDAAINAAAKEDEGEDRVAVHEPYPMNQAQQIPSSVTEEMVRICLEKQMKKEAEELIAFNAKVEADERAAAIAAAGDAAVASPKPVADAPESISVAGAGNQQGKKQHAKEQERIAAARKLREQEAEKKKLAKPKMKQGMPLKAVLAQDLHFGPDVIEHCLMKSKIDPNQSLTQLLSPATSASASTTSSTTLPASLLTQLSNALQEAPTLLDRIAKEPMPGYIFWRHESQDSNKTAAPQKKMKKPREKRNAAGELIVDEIDAPPKTVVTSTAAASSTTTASTTAISTPAASAPTPTTSTSLTSEAISSTPSQPPASSSDIVIYTEYLPILLMPQLERGEYKSLPPPLTFPSFDEAMDEFYSKIEEQKEEVRLIKERAAALQKLEREKQRQQAQLTALEAQQANSVLKAELIEHNLDAVNACIGSVNAEIAKGIDWRELTRIIKEEKVHGNNPIARMIHSLKLLENQITITLSEGMKHLLPEYAKDKSVKPVQIEIDLGLTAFANAQLYYESKKKHAEKQLRAESASIAAIKAAERKTNSALNSVDIRARIQKTRKVYWFEKFHWFISSENYLVIGGKDMQQNEMLVKKYLKANDIYVHADVHGASSVIVKNPTSNPVPPLTLSQAGAMTICRSAAWKNKVTVESYWVKADQVSKTAPTGLSLATGSFMIRGRKNFLPRAPLIMGIGLLFKLDDSCRSKHIGERRIRTAAETEAAELSEDKFDQVGELPDLDAGGSSNLNKSSSSKKKKSASTPVSSSSSKKKKKILNELDSDDFDVTSNLRPTSSAAAAIIGKLTSEDEATDAEEEARKSRLEQSKSSSSASAPAGKKKMSAAERKRLKKGANNPSKKDEDEVEEEEKVTKEVADLKLSAPPAPNEEDSSDDDDWGPTNKNKKGKKGKKGAKSTAAASSTGASSNPTPAPPAKLPRGKRNKLKRTQAKYANQDEEDLELAAQVLGLQHVDKKKKEVAEREKKFKPTTKVESESESSEEEADDEEKKVESTPPTDSTMSAEDQSKICFLCKERGHVFKTCPRRAESEAAGGTTFAQARKLAEEAEAAELQQLKEEEGVVDEEDQANSAAQEELELQGLTGKPFPDDLSHFILPVCAPYDALTDYKYKVKIVVGVSKKGKAAKQCLQLFLNQASITSEKELLKLVPEQEVINVLLSNIKLSAPGSQGDGKRRKGAKPSASKPTVADIGE